MNTLLSVAFNYPKNVSAIMIPPTLRKMLFAFNSQNKLLSNVWQTDMQRFEFFMHRYKHTLIILCKKLTNSSDPD